MKLKNEQDFLFNITVIPKSSRSEIKIDQSNNIKIYLNATPTDGKANAELLKLLSKDLKIPKSSIKIMRGEKSRTKNLFIENLTKEEVFFKLRKK